MAALERRLKKDDAGGADADESYDDSAPAPAPAPSAAPNNDASFTEERAKRVATNDQILLTFVNRIRLDFATTWVHHVRRLGMTNWLVGATDRTSLTSLLAAGTPTFDMATNLPEGEWPWGSASSCYFC